MTAGFQAGGQWSRPDGTLTPEALRWLNIIALFAGTEPFEVFAAGGGGGAEMVQQTAPLAVFPLAAPPADVYLPIVPPLAPSDQWMEPVQLIVPPITPTAESIFPDGIGYSAASQANVTQVTSKSTGVTANALHGIVVMDAAALAANTTVSFTLTNSELVAGDMVFVVIQGGASAVSYLTWSESCATGSVLIALRNITGGSLSEAVTLNFFVLKRNL